MGSGRCVRDFRCEVFSEKLGEGKDFVPQCRGKHGFAGASCVLYISLKARFLSMLLSKTKLVG